MAHQHRLFSVSCDQAHEFHGRIQRVEIQDSITSCCYELFCTEVSKDPEFQTDINCTQRQSGQKTILMIQD